MKGRMVVRSEIACLIHLKSHFSPSALAAFSGLRSSYCDIYIRQFDFIGFEWHWRASFGENKKKSISSSFREVEMREERSNTEEWSQNRLWVGIWDVSARNEKSMLSALFVSRPCHFS